MGENKGRLPFQVLIFPFIKENNGYLYCVFKRKDLGFWQGVSGGGESGETIFDTAKRELLEETGTDPKIIKLDSTTSIPSENIGKHNWEGVLIVPEYSFGAELSSKEIKISEEHSTYRWLPYEEAEKLLRYDSNKTALWELNKRLLGKISD